jgi:polyisoprenoid-binding protein YceI
MRALRVVALGALLAAAAGADEPAEFHYRIDPSASELTWELPATLHTVHGKAPQFEGRIDVTPGGGGEWKIRTRITVTAAAMETGNSSRDRTMREKTLETDKFPEIVFEARHLSGDLTKLKDGERRTVEVTGDLTVHGKSVSVRLPVDVQMQTDRAVLTGSFPLAWKEFGLNDPSFGIITVREPMKVLFRLTVVPEGSKPPARAPV